MSSTETPPAPESTRIRPALVLIFCCVAGFMTFLDVSIVNVALPTIENQLDIPQTQLQHIVTTYGLMLGGFLLLCGRLADYYGRRRMLRVGLLLFAASSLFAGLAQDAITLIVARGAQGAGAAFMATAALSLLTNIFSGARRNRALGAWGALSGIAAVAGVTLGGLLTEGPGWRWIFLINIPIGILGAALAPKVLPESRAEQRQRGFDTAGAIIATAGMLTLIFTLGETIDESGSQWSSPTVLIGLAVAAALLVGFVLRERRISTPLIPLTVFRIPALRAANMIAVLLLGTVVSLFFFASLFMQQVLNYSPVQAGLAYLPLAIGTAVGAGVATQLVGKFPAKPVLLTGLTLAAAGLLLLWRLPADGAYLSDVLPAFLLIGPGLGLSFVPVQIAAFTGVEQSEHGGMAAGLINTSQEAGGALGLAVMATIAFRRVPELTARAGEDPELIRAARASVFGETFLIGIGFLAAAIVVTLLMLPMLRPNRDTAAIPG